MAQRLTEAFINTNIPGAYYESSVKSTPVGVASSGNITIIGEAKGGAAAYGIDSVNGDKLSDNFFTPDQLSLVVAKYISGPIVDAFRAMSSPSSDDDIVGSANRIYISKTNKGSKSSAIISDAYGSLSDKNYGIDGSKYFYQITQASVESAAASIGLSFVIGDGSLFNGLSFVVRENGGLETVITLSGTSTDHDDYIKISAEISAQLPAAMECVSSGTDQIEIRFAAVSNNVANAAGFGKSFELVDASAGDLAAIGFSEGIFVSAKESEVQVDINRKDNNTNEQLIVSADVAMTIGYEGISATLAISGDDLTTVVSGGTGVALAIKLSEYATIKDLADFINSQTGYSSKVEATYTQKVTSSLDKVSAIGIATTLAEGKAGRIKVAANNFALKLGESSNLDFSATKELGLPEEMATVVYLEGGSKGSTSGLDLVNSVNDLEGINTNFIVPLFSRDATADIAEGLTDSGSTYTIDSVNVLVKNHILKMSTAKLKKHRTGILSFSGTFSEIKEKSGSLAHYRISLAFQKSSQANSVGDIVSFLPWHTAAIAAGMQAAGFYKAILNKFANVISFEDPEGFDSGTPGDIETALDAGLLFLEKAVTGSKWVSDQTTYGVDTNFVYNSIQAVYSADIVALDLTQSFQTEFVGKSLADINAAGGLVFLGEKMAAYKNQKLITASSDTVTGYKNAKITINGPVMSVSVEIKLATALYFIPISIEISQVSSAA